MNSVVIAVIIVLNCLILVLTSVNLYRIRKEHIPVAGDFYYDPDTHHLRIEWRDEIEAYTDYEKVAWTMNLKTFRMRREEDES